jgi:phage tail-like protein
MKSVKFLILFAFMASFVFFTKAQGVININETGFFKAKFTKDKVWDTQRSPAYPIAGQDWTLRGLKNALDASGTPIAWATGRYLMFVAEVDNTKGVNSLIDDINNNGIKYNVSLKLFESNGTMVKVVSTWGRLIGKGDKGFMYEAEGRYGTFFSVADLVASTVVIYKPNLAGVNKLSELVNSLDITKDMGAAKGLETPKSISDALFFNTKYTKDKVWDTQRSPAYPVAGQDWTLKGLKNALGASGAPIAWATGRYLMFFAEVDNTKGVNSFVDDINNNGLKYNISLKLFESNGTLVKVVSNWGRVIGIGDKGFIYEAEGKYGTFFSAADLTTTSVIIYKPSLAKATKLSEITKSTTNSVVVNQEPVTNPTNSNWPLPKFYFKVIYNNIEMSFQEVTGLSSEPQNIEYKKGDSPQFSVIKMPGLKKNGNVTLKKGFFKNNPNNPDWYNQTADKRGTMVISLLDEAGKTTMQWSLTNAWITKTTGVTKTGDQITIESMEVVHEGLTIK